MDFPVELSASMAFGSIGTTGLFSPDSFSPPAVLHITTEATKAMTFDELPNYVASKWF